MSSLSNTEPKSKVLCMFEAHLLVIKVLMKGGRDLKEGGKSNDNRTHIRIEKKDSLLGMEEEVQGTSKNIV